MHIFLNPKYKLYLSLKNIKFVNRIIKPAKIGSYLSNKLSTKLLF